MLTNVLSQANKIRIRIRPRDSNFTLEFKESRADTYLSRKVQFKLYDILGFGLQSFVRSLVLHAEDADIFVQPELCERTLRLTFLAGREGLFSLYRDGRKVSGNVESGEFELRLLDTDYLIYNGKIAQVQQLEADITLEENQFFGETRFEDEMGRAVFPEVLFALCGESDGLQE